MDGKTTLLLILTLFDSVVSFTCRREERFGNGFGLFFSDHGGIPIFCSVTLELSGGAVVCL